MREIGHGTINKNNIIRMIGKAGGGPKRKKRATKHETKN